MIKKITSSVLAITMLFLSVAVVPSVAYASVDSQKDKVSDGIDKVGGSNTTSADLPTLIGNIINILLFIAGAVAVVMIILGAIRYITSNGDQADVKAAKDTILYSVVGLVVAILAYAIVRFIVDKL